MTGVPEIARRFIGGDWQTGVAEDSGGGSQPGIRFPVAFDTPGILTGVTFWTPTAGDLWQIGLSFVSVPVAFDGDNTPTFQIMPLGGNPGDFASIPVNVADAAQSLAAYSTPAGSFALVTSGSAIPAGVMDGTPYVVLLDDGSGGNPGSSAGSAVIFVSVWPAP